MKASGNALGAQAAGERGWPDVEPYGADAVWEAILRRAEQEDNADDGPADIDFKGPEWQAFTRSGSIDLPGFTARKEPPPAKVRSWLPDVVLIPRLREVSALYGFTRIDSPEWEVLSTDSDHIGPIAREAPSWVPCAQTRGEGIFLRFSEDRLAAWESQAAIMARGRVLAAGHDKWRADRRLVPGEWPSVRYVLLHTFAHTLIRELALECGYSASGIAETADPRMAELLASLYAWMAAEESRRRSERTRAGLERRKREGLPVGRQPGATDKKPRRRSGYIARWERERAAAG